MTPTTDLRIALDANIICADPWLDGKESRVFFEGIQLLDAHVHVSRVALEEAVNVYAERLRECRARLENAARDWQVSVRAPRQQIVSGPTLNGAERAYEEHLLKVLEERGVEILAYPQVRHEELVRRDLDRRKPFSQRGGYRDALIWKSLLELLKANPAPVWFVTNNSKDFGSGPGPDSDLVRDLTDMDLSASAMRIFPSLAALNKECIVPHLQRRETKELGFSLAAWTKTELLEPLKDSRWTKDMIGVEASHVEVLKEEVRILTVIEAEVDELRLLPSGDTLVEAHAVLDLCYPVSAVEWLHHEDVRVAFPHLTEPGSTYFSPVRAQVLFGLVLQGLSTRVLSVEIEDLQGTVS